MPVDELVDPVGYSGWWAALGVLALLAAVALVVLVVRRTRATPAEKAAPPPAPSAAGRVDPYAALRRRYEERLDAVEQRFRAGELDERALHLALSAEVRGFATGRTGADASSMTLSEIEQLSGATRLTHLIARYYRPSFADHDNDPGARHLDAEVSIERARAVVREW